MYGESFLDEIFLENISLLLKIFPMQKINCLICSAIFVMQNMYFWKI